MSGMILGVEIGDASVRAVVVTGDGQVAGRADHPIGSVGARDAMREAVRKARDEARGDIAAAGIASASLGDAPNAALTVPLRDVLPGVEPVAIASGPASVLAEVWSGAGRGMNDVVAFAIGEHVTAGVVIGGRLWHGANGHAGSVAWLALNPVEREDYRRLGGLEAEVAAAGIVRRLVWRVKSGDRSNVVDQVGGELSRLTAAQVFAAARAGDGVCISVIRDTAKYVGMAVANLASVIDPQAVVLGGTLAASGDMMLEAIRHECQRRLRPAQSERMRLVLSTLGADAAAIGAARHAVLSAQ